jgi:hypothetical protein
MNRRAKVGFGPDGVIVFLLLVFAAVLGCHSKREHGNSKEVQQSDMAGTDEHARAEAAEIARALVLESDFSLTGMVAAAAGLRGDVWVVHFVQPTDARIRDEIVVRFDRRSKKLISVLPAQ